MSRLKSLSNVLVEKYSLPRDEADAFVTAMFDVIKENLLKEKQVKVKGLGTFKLTDVSSRESVDVNTGQRILLDGRSKITFTPENAVRDRINAPFSQFESFDIDDDANFEGIDDKYSDQPENAAQLPTEPSATKTSEAPIPPVPSIEIAPEAEPSHVEPTSAESSSDDSHVEPTSAESSSDDSHDEPASAESSPADDSPAEPAPSSNLVRWLIAIIAVLALLVIAAGGYIFYDKFYSAPPQLAAEPALEVPVDTVAVEVPADTLSVETSDTVASVVDTLAVFNSAPELKHLPYEVVSIRPMTLRRNYTVDEICNIFVGVGTQIYVQSVNDGRTEFKKGETILVPKLALKKK